jgi:hypothetical protein
MLITPRAFEPFGYGIKVFSDAPLQTTICFDDGNTLLEGFNIRTVEAAW